MPENDELKKYLDYDGLGYLIQRIPRTKIRVTFDDVFAGETATCSMGTTTYTKTVPATEPYELVFPINELGTWTIATSYLGDDYGTTVEVTAIGQTATGHVSYVTEIDGATVEPTDDIQTWLACAGITDKSYTTLAEVLADRETFETLIADSNACDYMARSTTWAKVEGAVPTMTDYTTPSGVVTYSTIYSAGYEAYKAFDNDDTTSWSTTQEGRTNAWVAYQFVNAVCINAVKITPYSGTNSSDCRIKNFKIQASNDNFTNDIHDLYTGIWNDFSNDTHYFSFDNVNSYTSYRLFVIDNYTSASTNIKTLQFYEADIAHSQDAMSLIGKYDYCSNELLSNATWKEAIVNSDYWESVCNGSVPKMTSNTAPEGECFSGSDYSASFPPYLAFDRTSSTYWLWGAIGTNNNYIGYRFPSTRKVYAMKAIFSKEGNPTNVTLNIQGSVNGTSDYVSLASFDTSSWVVGDNEVFVLIENPSNYLSYRILANGIMFQGSGIGFSTKDIQFYGRASSEVYAPLVPTMTSNTTPSGVAYATSELGDYLAWKAFNGLVGTVNDTNRWVSQMMAYGVDTYLSYDFGKQVSTSKIKIYAVRSGSVEHPLASVIHIEGSNDNTIWNSITTKSMTAVEMSQYTDINYDTVNYRYYRVYFESCNIQGSGNDYYSQVAYLQFYQKTVQTNIIHSAANDTIYMMENGSPVVLTTTNSDGDGILDFTQFMDGTYTLYSSVAKDPTNLSNDYSKSIRITKTSYGCTTEAYLMPDGALYWYGNTCDCLTGGLINAGHYPGHTANNIIFNSTSFTLSANGGNQDWGFQTANKISVTSAETIKMNIIANNNDMPLSWGLDSRYQPTSSSSPDIKSSSVNTVGVQSLSLSGITNGDYYVAGYNGQNGSYTRSMTIAFIIIV